MCPQPNPNPDGTRPRAPLFLATAAEVLPDMSLNDISTVSRADIVRGHLPEFDIIDADLRLWRATSAVDLGEIGTPWQRRWRWFWDTQQYRRQIVWEAVGSLSLDQLKQRILTGTEYPYDWIDDEFVAGEGNPARDHLVMIRYFKDRMAAATTARQVWLVLAYPYAGVTAFIDDYRMFPQAVYPVIGILRSGGLKAYRNEALAYWRGPRNEAGSLAGMLAVDSAFRCWTIASVKPSHVRRRGKAPICDIDVQVVDAGDTDLDALKAHVTQAVASDPGRYGGDVEAGIAKAASVSDLLDALDLPDDGWRGTDTYSGQECWEGAREMPADPFGDGSPIA